MRARALAVIILCVLVWIPLFLYWYFFTQKVSSVSIAVSDNLPFTLDLQGTLSSSWLPLADKFLHFQEICVSSCTLSPVPPVKYSLTITSTGRVDIHEDFTLDSGESRKLLYTLNNDIQIKESGGESLDTNLGKAIVDNANTTLHADFSLVGVGERNRVYALRKQNNQVQLGILSLEKFTPFRTLPVEIQSMVLDRTWRFFLATLPNNRTFILSVNMDQETEVPVYPDSVVFMNDIWKFQTSSWVYTYDGEELQENPRFTDFLDISPSIRLWYIDKDDTSRLSLSNFPSGESVLISLDRTTGKSYVVKKGLGIRTLFFHGATPAYIDPSENIWDIQI